MSKRDVGTHFPLVVPRYTKRTCCYCGAPIHWCARTCPAHNDLVFLDPLDARCRMPKDDET